MLQSFIHVCNQSFGGTEINKQRSVSLQNSKVDVVQTEIGLLVEQNSICFSRVGYKLLVECKARIQGRGCLHARKRIEGLPQIWVQ